MTGAAGRRSAGIVTPRYSAGRSRRCSERLAHSLPPTNAPGSKVSIQPVKSFRGCTKVGGGSEIRRLQNRSGIVPPWAGSGRMDTFPKRFSALAVPEVSSLAIPELGVGPRAGGPASFRNYAPPSPKAMAGAAWRTLSRSVGPVGGGPSVRVFLLSVAERGCGPGDGVLRGPWPEESDGWSRHAVCRTLYDGGKAMPQTRVRGA